MKELEIKELDQLKSFFSDEAAWSQQRIYVSQQKYVLELLKETGQLACKLANTPIKPNHKLGDNNSDATCGSRKLLKIGEPIDLLVTHET